jgi:hypothetical protein
LNQTAGAIWGRIAAELVAPTAASATGSQVPQWLGRQGARCAAQTCHHGISSSPLQCQHLVLASQSASHLPPFLVPPQPTLE